MLAKPVTLLLYPQKASVDTVSWLLAALSISVVFYALSTISNAVLQGIGKVNLPVVNAAVALVIQTVVLVPLLLATELGLFSLVIATVLYSLLMEGTEIQAGDNKDLPASRLVRSDYGGGGLRRISWPVFVDPY